MKKILITLSCLLAYQFSYAETVTCKGRTNNPYTTDMDFTVEITLKTDRISKNQFYRSRIRYLTPDGSFLTQGVDFSSKVIKKIDKIIYAGSVVGNNIELTVNKDGSIQDAVLNNVFLGLSQLPVQCEVLGSLPALPICPVESRRSQTLVESIIHSQDISRVDFALTCGADVNFVQKTGCTPLMFAVEPTCGLKNSRPYYSSSTEKIVEVVDFLINNGAFATLADAKGETALMKAAKFGVRDVYSSFVAAEVDFDAQDKMGNTALMHAVYSGDDWVVEQILEGNPDRTVKNKKGLTAFAIAKRMQKEDIMNLVRVPDVVITIKGQADGTCSPLEITLKQGQVAEFVLKATEKMFKLDATQVELDLMADARGQDKQTVSFENKGTFEFTCGYHGGNKVSVGKITIQ